MKRIISKYLPALNVDLGLAPVLSPGCRFSSRHSETLGNILSSSLFSSSSHNRTWLHTQGSYVCGLSTCRFCNKHNNKYKNTVACATGKAFTISNYINRGTSNVVYVVECTLHNLQYVGSTTRPLWTRISEHYHRASYNSDKDLSNVSKHFNYVHAGNVAVKFCSLEKVRGSPRGSDRHWKLLEREVCWIFNLQMRIPTGMNHRYDVDLFLK